ncbi:hypothetical protein GCM10023216_05060 [Isoptericola chiayiensis]|uniref:Sulfotransferase family protein n=1 Tax=Isoptericola chiayiensis TaxID=579446 RepID=A0ABP8Y3V5_9MICO|nr:sulfotransferase family 2 domain-containing protein [Isoptericola chiayiensis]NOV99534.1 hypothetical protein [Isoptericola chiayiensis]
MPIYLRDDKSVLFVHVPKTGGSSIETALRRSDFNQYDRDSATGTDQPNWFRRCSPQHIHAERLRETYRIKRFTAVFLVVRDPIARFRSEVAHRARKHRIRFTDESVESWTRTMFAKYQKDPYVLDNHLRPQSEFVLRKAQVYRYEDGLSAALADLDKRFDLAIDTEVPHRLNSGERRPGFSSSDVPISRGTEALLREFYREDFEAFGY